MLSRLGAAYREVGRKSDSRIVLEGATQLAPDNAGYHFQLGAALREDQQYPEAYRALQRAVDGTGFHAAAHRLDVIGTCASCA